MKQLQSTWSLCQDWLTLLPYVALSCRVGQLVVMADRKELVLASLNEKIQGAQLSKFPRFGRPERENWAALIHEQGHSGQNQFWELVRSI